MARGGLLADALVERGGILYDVALVVGFSLLTALAARIAIPLPFTPVPLTAQTLVVLLAGAVLGSRRGAASQLLYIAQGAAGLPVGAGGRSGPAWLLGPTGGYLLGFVVAAFVTGLLAERGWDRRAWGVAAAMALGNLAIYACGVAWLATLVRILAGKEALSLAAAAQAGMLPFLPGDLIKLLIAAAVLPSAWALLGRRPQRGSPSP